MTASREWLDQAACRDMDGDMFFPDKTGNGARNQINAAIAICNTCPVQNPCNDFRKRTHTRDGVWGSRRKRI